MALNDTIKKMHHLIDEIKKNLLKVEKGNKAAAQRVRTGSIKLEKLAKLFRKESVKAEKSGQLKKAKVAKKKAAPKKKVAKKKVAKKKAAPKKKVAKKQKVAPKKKTVKRKKRR